MENLNDNESNEYNQSSETLIQISRCPINCPVTLCQQTIGITSMLSHFIRDHKENFRDIDGQCRSVLVINENSFPFNQVVSLGILAYGGVCSKYEFQRYFY